MIGIDLAGKTVDRLGVSVEFVQTSWPTLSADDGLRRCHRHAEAYFRKVQGIDDSLGRAPWERVVQEGLLTRACSSNNNKSNY